MGSAASGNGIYLQVNDCSLLFSYPQDALEVELEFVVDKKRSDDVESQASYSRLFAKQNNLVNVRQEFKLPGTKERVSHNKKGRQVRMMGYCGDQQLHVGSHLL